VYSFLASIPSPSQSVLEIGPLNLRAYGVMIGLGAIAAVWLGGKRLAERGYEVDHASELAMWGVPFGLVGARLYHVITDWQSFRGRWIEVFYIWQGGLGILGGIAFGVLGAYVVMRRRNLPLPMVLDVAAPTLALAQAIGRWGNWWNQELYGRPTSLPWALEIDEAHRISGHSADLTFHPTFLYESLWNFALVGFILWLDKQKVLRRGRLFAVYTGGYALGRLWIEALRIDTASRVAGLRVNLWVFGAVLLISLYLVLTGRVEEDSTIDD
jgi:prolipoprotein diacylglyceryl transferase